MAAPVACPACGAILNRLQGRDGWAVEPVIASRTNWKLVERSRLATILACPRCEHVQEGVQ